MNLFVYKKDTLFIGQFCPSLDKITKHNDPPIRAKRMNEKILTIKEVAEQLKVTEKTIYRLLSKQEIPAFKVGGSWRFRQEDINNWITEQSVTGKDKTIGEGEA